MSWLEVLATPPKAGLPAVGTCIALTPGRLVLGRSYTGQIVVDVPERKRQHLAVTSAGGLDQVLDLASSNATFVNGLAVGDRAYTLQHGDIVEIAHGLVFRYFAHEEPRARCPRLEACIGDAPGDEARWHVYRDWLLERGDPLGLRMSVGSDGGDEDARRLGPMARPWRAGNLELKWRHGYVQTAVLRAMEWENSPNTYWCLGRLFEQEACRFLEELHVDLFTTHLPTGRPPFEKRARVILENLRHAPRTLRRLTLGPVERLEWTVDLNREFNRLREARPRLLTDRHSLVRLFSRVLLRSRSSHGDIQLMHQERVYRFGTEPISMGLGEWGIAWIERPGDAGLATPFKVNGRPLRQARLMHGDVVELSEDASFVVEES